MTKQIDGQEQAFANAGTTRPHGRAQRHVDRVGHMDEMVEEQKMRRPRVRRHRLGAAAVKAPGRLPPVPPQ